MVPENISQELRLKNIDNTRNYFLEEIEQNQLMNRKNKTNCTTPNYIEHILILASAITGSILISDFASEFAILIRIKNLKRIKNLCNSCTN